MPQTDGQSAPTAKILLVDDRPENLLALEVILEPLGQTLVRADSGAEALKRLLSDDFALILLDVQMPGMDGFETAALIRRREKSAHIPIIFVSAISKEDRYVFQGYSVGAVDYIAKPFDPEILKSKVSVFVELFHKNEQIRRQAELLHQSRMREAERLQAERERETERRYLSELAASEARLSQFKATLDATLDSVVLWDPQTFRHLYVNQGALDLLGHTPEEMQGVRLLDLLPSDDLPVFQGVLDSLTDGAFKSQTFETHYRRKDGGHVPVDVSLQFVSPAEGTRHLVSISRDITERKRVQAALAAAYEREKRIATILQESMLFAPPENAFPGLTIEALYQAAWDEALVGGDFFDVFGVAGRKVALVVGDVTGKGLVAASHIAQAKYALRAFLRETTDPVCALNRLNDILCRHEQGNDLEPEVFVTLALLILDPATGEASYTGAGCEPPLLLRADGSAQELECHGLPLGVAPGMVYGSQALRLAPQETIVMVTDGITEARSGRGLFGYEGLTGTVQQCGPEAALPEISHALLEAARAFAGGKLQDDACLLLARRL